MSEYLRRWRIIDHATRTTDAGGSWWSFEYAADRLDRATNVSQPAIMGRALAAMMEPAGRKRAGGGNHGGPYGRGKSGTQDVVDAALVIAWRAGRYDGIPRVDLVRRTADALHSAGQYQPSESTTSARIGEQTEAAMGAFDRSPRGGIRPSVYGLMRLTDLGVR